MTECEKEYAKIIGRNLRRIAYEHDKTIQKQGKSHHFQRLDKLKKKLP